MLAEGNYWATIKGGTPEKSPKKGTPCVSVKLDVTHRYDPADNGTWQPMAEPIERTLRIYLSDGAWEQSVRKLETLGFNGDFASPAFANTKGVGIACAHDEYEGRQIETIELTEWGGGEWERASEDDIRRCNAKWKTARTNAARNTAAPPAPAVGPDGEPIPF